MAMEAQPGDRGATVMERVRAVHLRMVDAVLGGDGLEGVATLAAGETGGVVAIVVPRLGAAAASGPVADLRRCAATSANGRAPRGGGADRRGGRGADRHGRRAARRRAAAGVDEPAPDAFEFLHVAAVACLTEVAVEEARLEVEQNLRGSFLEELRGRDDSRPTRSCGAPPGWLRSLARRGGAVRGAVLRSAAPRRRDDRGRAPGRAGPAHGRRRRFRARLRAAAGGADAAATLAAARRLAARLQRHGTVGVSSFYGDVADLGRAIQEAELVLDVLRRSDVPIDEDIGTGTYRLLFRVLASHPEEVRSFYEDTVAPLVAYDAQYSTDLVGLCRPIWSATAT